MNEQPRPTPQEWIDKALLWLADHPHKSTQQIAQAIDCADGRLIEDLLKAAWRAGKVHCYTEGHVWFWEATP